MNNNPLGTQKIVSLDFEESKLARAARETSKFQNWSHLTNSRRRYMAEILPIRRKTLSNQSTNHTVNFVFTPTQLIQNLQYVTVYQFFPRAPIFRYVRKSIKVVKNAIA